MSNVTEITSASTAAVSPLEEIEIDTLVVLHAVDEYALARAREREMARRVLAGEKLHLPLHDLQQRSAELRAQIQHELLVSVCRAAGIAVPAPVAESKGA